jgi:asparagine synthase (glutamine-hydrolysing)
VDRPLDRSVLATTLADLHGFLAPLLRRLDRTSMANSVECRVPFLDHRLVHFALQLPLSYRLGGRADKWVLKQVAEDYLPRDIIRRKKAGFPLPTAEFIAPLLAPALYEQGYLVRDLGLSWPWLKRRLAAGASHETGTFGLLTLELWGRLFIRGQTVEELDARLADMAGARPVPAGGVTGGKDGVLRDAGSQSPPPGQPEHAGDPRG